MFSGLAEVRTYIGPPLFGKSHGSNEPIILVPQNTSKEPVIYFQGLILIYPSKIPKTYLRPSTAGDSLFHADYPYSSTQASKAPSALRTHSLVSRTAKPRRLPQTARPTNSRWVLRIKPKIPIQEGTSIPAAVHPSIKPIPSAKYQLGQMGSQTRLTFRRPVRAVTDRSCLHPYSSSAC